MNIVIGTLLIWAAAIWMLRHLRRVAPERMPQLVRQASRTFVVMLPRTLIGLSGAGFVAALLPQDLMRQVFGAGSGMGGVALATLAGALVPGGPVVAFAVGAAAVKAGAGVAALLSFVTSWSVFSLTRTLTHEMTMMGWPFLRYRLLVSWPLPVAIGAVSLVATRLFGAG
ncbi:MAG: hypothetical protein Q8P60_15190 [Pseudorhodobacter sp.]|nr:hypothetical protein [Pseudorhodobacter sp.]